MLPPRGREKSYPRSAESGPRAAFEIIDWFGAVRPAGRAARWAVCRIRALAPVHPRALTGSVTVGRVLLTSQVPGLRGSSGFLHFLCGLAPACRSDCKAWGTDIVAE